MTQPYYETHVTFEGDNAMGESVVNLMGWRYSRIDGDPVVGEGVRQYATKHFNLRQHEEHIWEEMTQVKHNLEVRGLKVTRMKIEKVLRDERL